MNFVNIDLLFYIVETIGIFAFALSGITLARKKDFDMVGVYFIAWVTAFGGGMFRDVVLNVHPVYWVEHSEYPLMLFVFVFILSFFKQLTINESWLTIPDALGMAVFSITTAQFANSLGYSFIIVGVFATLVSVLGGIIRDCLCQEMPLSFVKGSPMYASIAFLGAGFYVILVRYLSLDLFFSLIFSILVTFIARVLVIRFNIILKI